MTSMIEVKEVVTVTVEPEFCDEPVREPAVIEAWATDLDEAALTLLMEAATVWVNRMNRKQMEEKSVRTERRKEG